MASGGGTKQVFEKYAKFGRTEAQIKEMKGGLRIETKNVQKLCKEVGIVDGKYPNQLLDNDISRVLGKFTSSGKYPKGMKTLDHDGFEALLDQIAESKKDSPDNIRAKVCSSSGPSLAGTTATSNSASVQKLTDTSQYTGAHKERFDESGKGKGIDGREYRAENTGYTGQYKNSGTYDKTHK